MKTYKEKIVEVKAVQWCGQNSGEVQSLTGREKAFIIPGGILEVQTEKHGRIDACISDYIVKNEDGELYVYSEKNFESTYEEVS